ncbi:MAG: hypothetical protein O7G87_22730, partial [bacterium]|nr:hypothetical protein [bacterium]
MKRLSRLKPKIALLAVGLFCLLCGTVEAQTREWAWEWSKVGELLEPMERQIFPGNTFTFCRVQYTFRSRRGRRFGVSGRLGELDARGRRDRIRGFWAT